MSSCLSTWLGCLLLSVVVGLSVAEPLPVVLWHGMGDSCCNPISMGAFMRMIQRQRPGIHTHSIRIGDNIVTDTLAGFLANTNDKVAQACKAIAEDPKLANGYNAIGFSQGAQFLRAVAQRCPDPPMHNLISLGGQHQGVYGIPGCDYSDPELVSLCKVLRKAVTQGAYVSAIQNSVVQAQYWHDPMNEARYRSSNIFLADINQENEVNEEYKANLQKLNAFVMVKFNNDSMVVPRESQWFGFYRPMSTRRINSLQQSALYKQDKLGLAAMDKAGKLHFLDLDSDHLQFSNEWFIETIIKDFL